MKKKIENFVLATFENKLFPVTVGPSFVISSKNYETLVNQQEQTKNFPSQIAVNFTLNIDSAGSWIFLSKWKLGEVGNFDVDRKRIVAARKRKRERKNGQSFSRAQAREIVRYI